MPGHEVTPLAYKSVIICPTTHLQASPQLPEPAPGWVEDEDGDEGEYASEEAHNQAFDEEKDEESEDDEECVLDSGLILNNKQRFSAVCRPTHAGRCALLSAHSDWILNKC